MKGFNSTALVINHQSHDIQHLLQSLPCGKTQSKLPDEKQLFDSSSYLIASVGIEACVHMLLHRQHVLQQHSPVRLTNRRLPAEREK